VRAARRALLVAAVIATGVAAPRVAQAWATVEHQEIGSTSYLAACAQVEALLAAHGPTDAGARARFELACGRNRGVAAKLYGDATAIAGDYVGHPSELLSPEGAWRFSGPTHYYLLALENSSHFNPMATESWREHHQTAIEDALAAAHAEGLARVEAFEQATRENAFGDHLLQDSFASGHMGFNRRASSAAAAKRFHDTWNERGRKVTDREGRTWTAYGDGLLDAPKGADSRRHAMDAATGSVRDVLLTFVLAERQPNESLAVWRALPFSIDAPELLIDAEALFEWRTTARDGAETPLMGTVIPARKNTVGSAKLWSAAPFQHDPTVAGLASVELALPVFPGQTALGAGATIDEPGGGHSAVAEVGLVAPLALSLDGLWSHEVEVAGTFVFLKRLETIVHAEYQGNIELGESLISVHLGIAGFFPVKEAGWYAAVGYGFVFSAAGGGSL
jgi:hypothetical protein